MSPEQADAALAVLHDAVVKIDATLNDGLKAMVAEHMRSADAVEGLRAFREKRKPKFA